MFIAVGTTVARTLESAARQHHLTKLQGQTDLFIREGYKFKFVKLAPDLLDFGITVNHLRYSDIEKTILDFIYTWRYNGVPRNKIILDVEDWAKNISKSKITKYSERYPKTVREIVGEVVQQ